MSDKPVVSLLCGYPPSCDRCGSGEAKAQLDLPTYGRRCLCNACLATVIEAGLKAPKATQLDHSEVVDLIRQRLDAFCSQDLVEIFNKEFANAYSQERLEFNEAYDAFLLTSN